MTTGPGDYELGFLNENAASKALREHFAASKNISLAVAFWGAGATRDLGLDKRLDAKIVLNLAMGGTNPAEVVFMRELGLDVRQADDLHGKVYLFDDVAIIGSSNASSNGLAFQNGDGLGWREANILVEDAQTVDSARLWVRGLTTRPITEEDLDLAQIAWRKRRDAIANISDVTSLLDQLEQRPGFFRDRAVYLTVWMDQMDPEAVEALEEIKGSEGLRNLSAWQSFPDLPREGHFLDFELGERGGVTGWGLWERSLALEDRELGELGDLQFCRKSKTVFGLGYRPAEIARWKTIVQQVYGSAYWNAENRCAVVPFSELKALAPGASQGERFHQSLQALYQRILLETDYRPSRFHSLLAQGGVSAARALLARNEVSDGFSALAERRRLDLTIEHEVLEPRWAGLFDERELRAARRRLGRND